MTILKRRHLFFVTVILTPDVESKFFEIWNHALLNSASVNLLFIAKGWIDHFIYVKNVHSVPFKQQSHW